MNSYTVLISVYCKENPTFLKQSMESVFMQTIPPNEVILVKDGVLTQELENVINYFLLLYPNVLKIVSLLINQGLGKALNEGLKYCNNELVARMDTDDIALSDRFEKQLNVFLENPSISVCGGTIEEFSDNPNDILTSRVLPSENERLVRFAKIRNPINHMTVMFRKEDALAVGGYKHCVSFEDYYLWIRMIVNNYELYNLSDVLVKVRFSSRDICRRSGLKYAINEFKFTYKIYKIGFINVFEFILLSPFKFSVRILPKKLISLIYRFFLR